MTFLIGGANSLTGGYNIDNSLRFNSGDSADLRFTPSSAGTEETFTISAWIKKSMVGASNGQDCYLFSSQADSNNRTVMGVFGSSSTQGIFFENKVSGTSSYVDSDATFRDSSAWYHAVWAIDTTQGTNTNRVKLYINGSQITSFDSTSYLDQNVVTQWSRAQVNYIGSRAGGNYYDGYMAEVHVIDGTQKAASDFGETNDNGVWIPKKYSGTYGTNGYYLEFKQTGTSANASGIGADTSGNTSHWTPTNLAATDITTDTPTNNFCTINPININIGMPPTITEGNTKFTVNSSANSSNNLSRGDCTIAPSNGKWYVEFKYLSGYTATDGTLQIGVISANAHRFSTNNDMLHKDNGNGSVAISVDNNGRVQDKDGTDLLTGVTTFTVGDTMSVCLDLDNDKFFVGKNGSFFSNGTGTQNPATGANPLYSGGFLTTHKSIGFEIVACGYGSHSSGPSVISYNYGNPHISIDSSNSDANGYGNFEYAVPSGYYSLCTKNLAEFG